MREYFVYLLRCADDTYYTGVTNDLRRRLIEHASGRNATCYTFERRPLMLVHAKCFRDVRDAIGFEKVVKAWSRKKKEALIAGDRQALRVHSKKKFPKRYKRRCIVEIKRRAFLVRSALRAELLGMTRSS